MKRVLTLGLALLMLLGALAACSKNKPEEQGESASESTDVEIPYDPDIDGLNFGGLPITMLQSVFSDVQRHEFSGGEDQTDAINDLIYKRNEYIQEKFGIMLEFENVEGAEIQDIIRANNRSAATEIDMFSAYAYYGLSMSNEGSYANLYDIEYLDTTSRWWNQSWNESVEYNDRLYAVAGDANTSIILKTFVTFVNNDMLSEWYPTDTPDLYSVVNEGKWTLEYVKNLVKNVYDDNGTDSGVRDENDTYGITMAPISQPSQALIMGCGYQWTETTGDGDIVLTLDNSRNVSVLQEIQTFFKGDIQGIYNPEKWAGAYYYANHFAKGNNLMAMAPMFTAEQLAKTDIFYSILPMPKYDENQTDYISSTQDSHTFCAVSTYSDAHHAVGAILEYMGYISERDLVPQYFDKFYKNKYASDAATMAMFDSIIENIRFEFAVNWSNSLREVLKKVRLLAASPSVGVSSELVSIRDVCAEYLDQLKEDLNE